MQQAVLIPKCCRKPRSRTARPPPPPPPPPRKVDRFIMEPSTWRDRPRTRSFEMRGILAQRVETRRAKAQREAEAQKAEVEAYSLQLRASKRIRYLFTTPTSRPHIDHVMSSPQSPPLQQNLDTPETAGSTVADSSIRRGRGPARQIQRWGSDQLLQINWNNRNQPFGPAARKLATQLGNFARNGHLFPLTVTMWDGIDERSLNKVWEEVKANTNAPEGYKNICLKQLGLNWKKHKSRVKKKYYNPDAIREDLLALVPPEVKADQWPKLVDYWRLPEVEAMAARNKRNRILQAAFPRTGRIPFVDVEENLKSEGKECDRISIWKATRGGEDGKYSTKDGAAYIEAQIRSELEKIPVEQRNTAKMREKVFQMVIGVDGHGHVLCRGVGLSISSVNASSLLTEHESHVRSEVERIQSEFLERERAREELHQKVIEELRVEMMERERALEERQRAREMEQERALEERERAQEDRFMRMMEERLGGRVDPTLSRE